MCGFIVGCCTGFWNVGFCSFFVLGVVSVAYCLLECFLQLRVVVFARGANELT